MLKSILVLIVLGCVLGAPAADVVAQDSFATSADVKLANVRSLIEARDYAAAELISEQVTIESPGTLDGWMLLGYTRTLNGKFELANQAYDQALNYGADRTEVYVRKAYNCRRLGDAETTRECYEAILEVDENNVEVMMQFGSFEMQMDEYDAAVHHFESALKLDPANFEAYESIAKVEEKRGRTANVKYWLEAGLEQFPGDARLLKRMALTYLNEQGYKMAIHYLDKALKEDPTDVSALRNRGIAYYQQGNKASARDDFEKVRSLDGKMNGLYGPLADCYREAGRTSDALAVIKDGIEEGTQKAWLFSIWGKMLEDGAQYDAAIGKFQMAVSLNDEPWSSYARKQIGRQAQLKKRAEMIAAQGAMD